MTDSGWGEALKRAPIFLLLPLADRLMPRGVSRLVYVRAFWISLALLPVIVLPAIAAIAPFGRPFAGLPDLLLIAAPLGSAAVAAWVRRRPLSGDAPAEAADQYVAVTFILGGLTSSAFLTGVVGSFIVEGWWICLPTLAIASVMLGVFAPTARDIARRQRELLDRASPVSLVEGMLLPRATGGSA